MAAFPTSRTRAGANNAITFEVLILNYELCAQGTNYVSGFQSFKLQMDTLEHTRYAIPTGFYRLRMTYSPRFKEILPILDGVIGYREPTPTPYPKGRGDRAAQKSLPLGGDLGEAYHQKLAHRGDFLFFLHKNLYNSNKCCTFVPD